MTDIALRYGGLGPDGELPTTPVVDLMLRHRSVRNFLPRPVSDELLRALIAAGQSASTSSNLQTTSVIAVRDPERRRQLSEMAGQALVAEVPLILCFVADLSRAHRVGQTLNEDLFALSLLDTGLAGAVDCAVFAQNVALAAESFGLGVCFIGNLRNEPVRIARLLNLPDRSTVVFGLCLGYEDGPETGIRPRLPQQLVLHEETYTADGEEDVLNNYDEVCREHERSQGREAIGWRERHPGRLASYDYLRGREHLREQFAAVGYPLD